MADDCECTSVGHTFPFESLAQTAAKISSFEKIHEIFLWKNVNQSFVFFVCANAFFVVMLRFQLSLISFIFLFLCISIIVGFGYIYGSKCYQHYLKGTAWSETTTPEIPFEFPLSPSSVADVAFAATEAVAIIFRFVSRLVNWESVHGSIVYLVFFFLTYLLIGRSLSGLTVLYLLTLFCFIWAPLYSSQHELIDNTATKLWNSFITSVEKFMPVNGERKKKE